MSKLQVKEVVNEYNRKISVLEEFKSDLQKHLPPERVARINKKCEQKINYYSIQKFNLLANKPNAVRLNNIAVMLMIFIAIGALGYFSSSYYKTYSNDFTGFSISDLTNESHVNESYQLNDSYQANFRVKQIAQERVNYRVIQQSQEGSDKRI